MYHLIVMYRLYDPNGVDFDMSLLRVGEQSPCRVVGQGVYTGANKELYCGGNVVDRELSGHTLVASDGMVVFKKGEDLVHIS